MITLGRLQLDNPQSFAEAVGESITKVGAMPVPASRQGLSTSLDLKSDHPTSSLPADRAKIRRQLRSLLNNLPMRLEGLWLTWDEDSEQDGWYVPGGASFSVDGMNGLSYSLWNFSGIELALVGRDHTHRRAVSMYIRDRTNGTTPLDYLKTQYGTAFASSSKLAMTWLPSNATDLYGVKGTALTTARTGYGSASMQAILGGTDLGIVSIGQGSAYRHRGDVVIYDRRGTVTAPGTGPSSSWEEVYGSDYHCTSGDVPVMENSFARVRYDSGNNPGFVFDWWGGTAWSELGKILVERTADSTSYLDTLLQANVKEWTPDRGVLKVVMGSTQDDVAREEVYITLQRGWSGPRIEAYGANGTAGNKPQMGLHFYGATATTSDMAYKLEGSDVMSIGYGGTAFTPGSFGSAGFPGENWFAYSRNSVPAVTMNLVQTGTARIENNTTAYGSARNGISVTSAALTGYVSAHFGNLGSTPGDTKMEAEGMTLGSGSTAGSDATASNGSAVTATRTSSGDHVTRPTWMSDNAQYRVMARVRTSAGGTLSCRAICGGVTGTTKTTTSTSYVWLDLGTFTATSTTLQIQAWISAGTLYVDRIEALKLTDRAAPAGYFNGVKDIAQSVLYDSRSSQTIVAI